MKKIAFGLPWILMACCGSLSLEQSWHQEVPPNLRDIKHVITIVLENTAFDQAYEQPYLKVLAQKGALLRDYHAITHPSQPNYIAMIAGTTYGITSNANVDLDASKRHLGDLLEQAGKDWKVYAEGYPGNCFLGKRNNKYVRKHVPFLSFQNVQTDPARCANIVELAQIFTDSKNNSLPSYSMVIPDLDNCGHDTDIAFASRWLQSFLEPLLSDEALMRNTLFVVTFDEDDKKNNNQIYCALIGAGIRARAVSNNAYSHYSLLNTVEKIFHLGDLGKGDRDAPPILDVWQ